MYHHTCSPIPSCWVATIDIQKHGEVKGSFRFCQKLAGSLSITAQLEIAIVRRQQSVRQIKTCFRGGEMATACKFPEFQVRVEDLAYCLLWTRTLLPKSTESRVDLVEMPRLGLSFQVPSSRCTSYIYFLLFFLHFPTNQLYRVTLSDML